jgi:hypothetical protein
MYEDIILSPVEEPGNKTRGRKEMSQKTRFERELVNTGKHADFLDGIQAKMALPVYGGFVKAAKNRIEVAIEIMHTDLRTWTPYSY